jgi:hypothetical protein
VKKERKMLISGLSSLNKKKQEIHVQTEISTYFNTSRSDPIIPLKEKKKKLVCKK